MTIVNIATWVVLVLTWVAILRSNYHRKAGAYFRGRADECEMIIQLDAFPPQMRREIRRMILRNQLGEYLGEREADAFMAEYETD